MTLRLVYIYNIIWQEVKKKNFIFLLKTKFWMNNSKKIFTFLQITL